MSDFFWFSDDQWARIEPLLPQDTRGMLRVDDRRVLSGIVHALKSGGCWSDCPSMSTVRRRRSTTGSGAGPGVVCGSASLPSLSGPKVCRPGFLSTAPASRSTALPEAQKGALAHGIGITKGGRNTKLHAVCDETGRPHVLLLTPGNTHDAKVAMLAINAVPPWEYLVADKEDYDSNALRSWLIEHGTTPVIPSKSNRKVQIEHDRQIYKQRNVVERMVCRFKDWRRVATRFDRNSKSFMATIAIAATVTRWL